MVLLLLLLLGLRCVYDTNNTTTNVTTITIGTVRSTDIAKATIATIIGAVIRVYASHRTDIEYSYTIECM
jgi:hypothetical protein